MDQAAEYPWYEQSAHAHQPRFGNMSNQMTPEETIINSASQLQNPRGYDIDPALGGGSQHQLNYAPETQYKMENGARQSMPPDVFGPSYGEVESQVMERSDEQDEVDSMAGVTAPAKKASKSSAANELEMRQLFQASKGRSLPEIAAELHGNERGPNSERQRQAFAMLWYVVHLCLPIQHFRSLNLYLPTGSIKYVPLVKVPYQEVESMRTTSRDAQPNESRS